jgi:L-arabinokinase
MKSIFSAKGKIHKASSPGRLDVMGGVADYSGSLLLQMPIRERVNVRLQKREDGWIRIVTKVDGAPSEFGIHWNELDGLGNQQAGSLIRDKPGGQWATYILGCFILLSKEKKLNVTGATIEIDSEVPWGKGVSSSAALEISVMQAIADAWKLKFERYELPVLCQRVENEITGAACGLMDQLSVYFGKKSQLLPVICQPYAVEAPEKIPDPIRFYGIDSGVRHAVSGSSYAQVRVAAFMGYSIIALLEGASLNALIRAKETRQYDHLPFNGYLANIALSLFVHQYEHQLPEKLAGADFLRQYGVSIDSATSIDPTCIYHIRACVRHPVEENFRIRLFRQFLKLKKGTKETEREKLLGELMFQSHESYSRIGLGNERTDEIVHMVREAGFETGVFGARITGGGSGGTVCILTSGGKGKETIKEIHAACCARYGTGLYLFKGSSNGALTLKQN